MPSIDTDIIKSLGAGSGIDTKSLVNQLTEIERIGPQARIDRVRDKAEAQISDFGLLTSAMATLEDAAKLLSEPEGLFSKSAAYTDSDALIPVELDTDVQAGSYVLEVTEIAAAQSLSSTTFSNKTDAVGEGTLTFNMGAATVVSGKQTAFALDTSESAVVITIDSTNNTLEGLRDAINDADFGVQATIVFDGADYVLQMNAASGENNELEIVVSESGGSPSNNDASDLSRFAFNSATSDVGTLVENQGGQDASIKVNGLTVTRESNTIDDVIQGLTFDVLKKDPGVPITITVSEDKAFAEQNIRDFVEAYNLFTEAIQPAVGTIEEEDADGKSQTIIGSLRNDSLAKSVVSRIRSVISNVIPGLGDTSFTALSTIGIRTELDGSLVFHEDTFKESMDDHFEDVQKLLAPQTVSSDSGVFVNGYGDDTVAGEYDIVITTQPARSVYQGQAVSVPLDTTGKTHTFKVNVNGDVSEELTLPNAVYADNADIASAMQVLINSDETLTAAGAAVLVSYDSDNNRFDITSTKYGAASNVAITEASAETISELGLTVASAAIAGATVAGTVNGVEGFGSANVLLPAIGEPGERLALIIGDNATTATVNFSRGFAGEMESTLNEFLESNGLFDKRELTLNDTLDELTSDEERLDVKMTAFQERLMNQFIAMERILNGLNSSGGFLESLIDTLPFTAKR